MSQRHSLRNPSTKGTKTKENSFETVEIQEEIVEEVVVDEHQPEVTFKIVVIG